jgi:hypothetical protein
VLMEGAVRVPAEPFMIAAAGLRDS